MDYNLLEKEIILGNNTLSADGKEEVIYEILDIYHSIENPRDNLTIMQLSLMSDKNLVISLGSAYEYFAFKFFNEVGRKPENISKSFDI